MTLGHQQGLRVIGPHYIDRGRLYELIGVKIISLCALEVEILNVHVFAPQHGQIYYVLHI